MHKITTFIFLLAGLLTSQAQVQPTAITVEGNTYQVIYESDTADKGHIMATLQDKAGVQGNAMFILKTNSTAATLYFKSVKYLWTTTTTSTNIAKIPEPPQGAPSDQVITTDQLKAKGAKDKPTKSIASIDKPVTIDVLIVYTPAAAIAVGGVSNVLNNARMAVAEANQVHKDSHIYITLNLVATELVNYTETASMSTDLQQFSKLPEVLTMRDTYKADLVCMFNSSPDYY
jgi:hypothetical protein